MKVSQDRRKMKIKVDGKYLELEVSDDVFYTTSALLRLIEYKYLFPHRSIKYVEKNGEVLHPVKVDEVKDLETINIVTEPSVNMVKKQIELALITLDAMIVSLSQIANEWIEKEDTVKLLLNNLLDSLEWTIKVVENGSKILPIYEGLDEAIAKLEDKIFKVDELMIAEKEKELVEFLTQEFSKAIREWKEFLKSMVQFVKSASGETH